VSTLISALVSDWAGRIHSPLDIGSTESFFTAADGTSAWIVAPVAGRVVTLSDEVRGMRRGVVTTNDVEVIDRYLVTLFARLAIGPGIQLPDSGEPIALVPTPAADGAPEPLVALNGPDGLWAQSPVSRAAELRLISGLVRYTTAQLDEFFRAQLGS
jgi:hypothetical protein